MVRVLIITTIEMILLTFPFELQISEPIPPTKPKQTKVK